MKFNTEKSIVVVPWDFSDLSHDSLIKAHEMTDDPSLIRVIHVAHLPPPIDYGVMWGDSFEANIRDNVTEAFKKSLEDRPDLAAANFTVLVGDPGIEVCRFAKELEAGVIVMPSHGRSGFSRLILGSVAERIVRFAPCPVLILREPTEEETNPDFENMATSFI